MLQHFVFWRSRKVQQDSVFDHVASANVQSGHSSSFNRSSPGLQELPCVGNAGGQLRRETMHSCPTQSQMGLLKGCRWDRGYNKGSRQCVSWEVSRSFGQPGVAWSVGEWLLGFLCRGNVMVQLVARRGGEKLVAVSGFLWEWALVHAGLATQAAAALTQPREWKESMRQHQQDVGHWSALGWLKPTDSNQAQKRCLQERLLKLLICWWLCELLNKRAVFFWRCDMLRWNMPSFMLALFCSEMLLIVDHSSVLVQY